MIKFGGLAQGQGLAAAIDLRTAGLCPQTLRQLFGAWASTPGRTGASKVGEDFQPANEKAGLSSESRIILEGLILIQ